MDKHVVLAFANSLGLEIHSSTEQLLHQRSYQVTYYFYHRSLTSSSINRDLIAKMRLDDEMNIVDYNNALAICMNTLKQYQSWS